MRRAARRRYRALRSCFRPFGHPGALRFSLENRPLSPYMNAFVKPPVHLINIPSNCLLIIRSTRPIGSKSSPVRPLIAVILTHQLRNSFWASPVPALVNALNHLPHLTGHAHHATFDGNQPPLLSFLPTTFHPVPWPA